MFDPSALAGLAVVVLAVALLAVGFALRARSRGDGSPIAAASTSVGPGLPGAFVIYGAFQGEWVMSATGTQHTFGEVVGDVARSALHFRPLTFMFGPADAVDRLGVFVGIVSVAVVATPILRSTVARVVSAPGAVVFPLLALACWVLAALPLRVLAGVVTLRGFGEAGEVVPAALALTSVPLVLAVLLSRTHLSARTGLG